MHHRPLALAALVVSMLACGEPRAEDEVTAGSSLTSSEEARKAKSWIHGYAGDLEIDGMASDAAGDVYSTGYFVGRVELDASHVLESVADAKGRPTKDIFVAKHARLGGAIRWARHFGGSGAEGNAYDAVVGPDGSVVLSGAFSGTVDFDGTRLVSTMSAGSGNESSGTYGNMFVAALAPDGSVRWARQAGGSRVSGGNEIAVDEKSGGYVQVGMYGGTKEAGGSMTLGDVQLVFGGGFFDTYVAKITASGTLDWARHIGGNGAQRGKAIATDDDGNVLVAGDAWSGETRFAFGSSFSSDDQQDFWVAKYGARGDFMWFRKFATDGFDEVKGIAADSKGNVIVSAAYGNTGVAFSLTPDGKTIRWSNTITSVSKCCEMETDGRDRSFLANSALAPNVVYGSGERVAIGGSPRGALLTKLGVKGDHLRSWTIDADEAEIGELSLLPDGFVAVSGSFTGADLRMGDLHLPGSRRRQQFVLVIDGAN